MANVLSDDKKRQVLALGRLAWSLRKIEEATGVRRETAGTYLRAAGVAVRARRQVVLRPKPANGHRVSTDAGGPKPASGEGGPLTTRDHRAGDPSPPQRRGVLRGPGGRSRLHGAVWQLAVLSHSEFGASDGVHVAMPLLIRPRPVCHERDPRRESRATTTSDTISDPSSPPVRSGWAAGREEFECESRFVKRERALAHIDRTADGGHCHPTGNPAGIMRRRQGALKIGQRGDAWTGWS